MKYIIQLLFILIFTACNKNILPSESDNTPPTIQQIILTPSEPEINEVVELMAIASDIDKQELNYRWSVSDGALTNNNVGNPIYWSTPSTSGNVIITCMVYDGIELVTKSIGVDVLGNEGILDD